MLQKPRWQEYTKNGVTDWRTYSRVLLKYTTHLEDIIKQLNTDKVKENKDDKGYGGMPDFLNDIFGDKFK